MLRNSMTPPPFILLGLLAALTASVQTLDLHGRVTDPQGRSVARATVHLQSRSGDLGLARTDPDGQYQFKGVPPGQYALSAEASGFTNVTRQIDFPAIQTSADLRFTQISVKNQSLVITSSVLEPGLDLRNSSTFNRTLFSRDDQTLQQLNAGINAGQHEGGGKSLEIRRFGFNLDHGGVNGGLIILLDGVQQNQGTQGH
ncbi:MAG TPA: carboxypeptidase-like regulatory domain-containing protein, partial [Bryobacteraceae bacterium]|nr:carboxypeptidase-like regulatory domain-containing protein [Bryobacteraceae bacterium]